MDRRYKMDGYGIWCDICPWRHTLKPSKCGQPTKEPIFAHLAPRRIFSANKVNIISNVSNVELLTRVATSLLVIRNEPQNYTSLTEIAQICIIPLSGATRWRFNRLTWGYYKINYIMRLLSKICEQLAHWHVTSFLAKMSGEKQCDNPQHRFEFIGHVLSYAT